MKVIDAHTHVFPQYANMAIQVMDKCGIEKIITLEWHDGFGETLKEHMKIFNQYPNRFIVFGNVDFRKINEPDFAKNAAIQMEKDVAQGMRGLKIYKALGLDYRQTNGELWRISDERLNPIWEKAGELEIPILIHTADPAAFWQPVNERNFWNGVLYGEYAWWTYYRKGFASREELLAERNEVIARNPKTLFICPHMGSNSENLDSAAEDLDNYPNLNYDLSARIPILGLPGRNCERSREFFLQYQDRIIFGTDMIYDDVNVPTGIQAQSLYQPGEIPLENADYRVKYIETSVEFFKSHLDFIMTNKVQHNPPFKRNLKGYSIVGLELPEEICEKILFKNIELLLP